MEEMKTNDISDLFDEHDVCYFVGIQKGFGPIKDFPIGNCIYCNTTKALTTYEVLENCYLNGKQLYVRRER